ncbi:hypothetical protein [Enterobacter chuandaensis]|uniref:hypothetical protein n=1 Tax=Enterobacter chuandaensis TaxID=2497875 RepID=UPI0020C6269C|nr:hypothetical protein [Enterobacter chuandaensis]
MPSPSVPASEQTPWEILHQAAVYKDVGVVADNPWSGWKNCAGQRDARQSLPA